MGEVNNENIDSTNSATVTNNTSPTSAVTNVYAKNNKNNNNNNNNKDDDDDDDSNNTDEIMTDAIINTTTNASPSTTSSSAADKAVIFSPELLKAYYSRFFPFELLYSWLAYDPTISTSSTSSSSNNNNNKYSWIFSRREFSMTIEPTPGEEIYIRYQSFTTQSELSTAIIKRRPTKIDLGAIFSIPPKDHKTVQTSRKIQPIQRELVFDIDLTDYDDIRYCGCSGASICCKCWKFMTMAVELLDIGLKQDFGFQYIAWFYSGRRGIHCWICDESARTLTNEARNAVATYFEVQLANDNNKDIELSLPLHPSLQRAYNILEPWFIQEILPSSGHGLLASAERWKKDVLEQIPQCGYSVATLLEKKWNKDGNNTSPLEKWEQLKRHIKVLVSNNNNTKTAKTMTNRERNRLEYWPMELVFRHTYPRLDINVSKTMNHLLKSPFCVHPKTGRVCVPIQANQIRQFDPFLVPTLSQLMTELDDYEKQKQKQIHQEQQEQAQAENKDNVDMKDGDENNTDTSIAATTTLGSRKNNIKHDWQKTSLKEYFEPFQQNFLEPMLKELRKKDKMEAEQEAAMRGDF